MAVRPACSRLSIQKPVSSAPIRGVSKFQGDVTSLFRSSGDLAEPRLWPVIPAPCARVERMMPAAQAGGTRAAEQRAVLPARPSGPAPVLGDAGRRSRGAKSPKTRSASAGSVVLLARCGTVASQWHASIHGGPVKPDRLLFCVRSSVPRSANNPFQPLGNH